MVLRAIEKPSVHGEMVRQEENNVHQWSQMLQHSFTTFLWWNHPTATTGKKRRSGMDITDNLITCRINTMQQSSALQSALSWPVLTTISTKLRIYDPQLGSSNLSQRPKDHTTSLKATNTNRCGRNTQLQKTHESTAEKSANQTTVRSRAAN